MYQTKQLTPQEKSELKAQADKHIDDIQASIQTEIDDIDRREDIQRRLIPVELQDFNLKGIDAMTNPAVEMAIAKILFLGDHKEELRAIQKSPYFVRLDLKWKDNNAPQTLYISKYSSIENNIYSWIAPIATLRYSELGDAEYTKPNGDTRSAEVNRKDNFLIAEGDIVFMTHQDHSHDRQVVFQKHIEQRRAFILPEIVAELDRLQDQIIRSDPRGAFLISGPAGSGKTTLALHRIAYLVLTPEFKDFFKPERIIVFVSNDSDIRYFSKLLPELGINGVNITTFAEWALMIINSRFRSSIPNRFKLQDMNAALEFIKSHNPYPQIHPRLILDEYRKLKQQMILPVSLHEGSQKPIYPALHSLYLAEPAGIDKRLFVEFTRFIQFQKKHKFLDEIDLTIILANLENPITPFVHIVVDEVQNWLPEQLRLVKSLGHFSYKSLTYIGDIRQKTKTFTINSWNEVDEEFEPNSEHQVELLQVYRNSRPILEYLINKGYQFELSDKLRTDGLVDERTFSHSEDQSTALREILKTKESRRVQVGILAKYAESLNNITHLSSEFIHVLTIESAQGLEFDTVIILDHQDLELDSKKVQEQLGYTSAQEYSEQNKHLFYVAATRSQNELHVFTVQPGT